MTIIPRLGSFEYVAASGDWRLVIGGGAFNILPQVGGWDYGSGVNLDNLAQLIVDAKAHAVANGINWSNN
jgi:hypothetical protein